MANQKHHGILKQGVEVWNQWRKENPHIEPDLRGADLRGADLRGAILSGTNLMQANLQRANLQRANLRRANLWGAVTEENLIRRADIYGLTPTSDDLYQANLSQANLQQVDFRDAYMRGVYFIEANLYKAYLSRADLAMADFRGANLSRAELREAHLSSAKLNEANLYRANLSLTNLRNSNLSGADLREADMTWSRLNRAILTGANLERANLNWTDLSEANLKKANLTGCSIHGISAWNVQLKDAIQSNLVITDYNEPIITVDNLKIAQFIYLLLTNEEIRDAINTLTTKSVLILGRFTPERKAVLDALREALRQHNYLPILFDFEKPASRSITETISTLAHLARFIIADLTDPSSIPQELQAIVPTLAVPVQPVLLERKKKYSMFSDFLKTYHWVLPVYYYRDEGNLLATLKEQVIEPAEQKALELEKR